MDYDNDSVDHSKIELTKAEAEAIDRGLQVLVYVLGFIPISAAIWCVLSCQLCHSKISVPMGTLDYTVKFYMYS